MSAAHPLDNVQSPEDLARLVFASSDGAIRQMSGRPANATEIGEMVSFYQRVADELRKIQAEAEAKAQRK